jgi:hypothetical protein
MTYSVQSHGIYAIRFMNRQVALFLGTLFNDAVSNLRLLKVE